MSEEKRLLGEGEGRAEEGLSPVTESPQPVSLARAGRGDGQSRVAQGEAHDTCVTGGFGLDQSRRAALCLQKVPSVVSLAGGRAAEQHRLDPPCQSLAILGSWACSLLAWGAVIAEGFEPLISCRALGLSAAFCVENSIFEPRLPFRPHCSPPPLLRDVLSSRLLYKSPSYIMLHFTGSCLVCSCVH